MALESLADSSPGLLSSAEQLALNRWRAAYALSAYLWELELSQREASRWQFCRWLVATGRLGADDRAEAEA